MDNLRDTAAANQTCTHCVEAWQKVYSQAITISNTCVEILCELESVGII
jgi:hypothetical protein